ncbi:MAG TPA: aldo/keto reductase [Chloroflexi bacterium]|nr:aldo/keto reductase [Chloroflexota bacterium]
MEYRTFPKTPIRVSAISFGCWTVGDDWWGHIPDTEALDLLRYAFDRGITFFDNSNTYGRGRAERLLGEALAAIPRNQYVIAAKFGYDIDVAHARAGQRERPHNWNPSYIRASLEGSLRRLRTDYVELYLLHNPRMDAIRNDAIFETLEALKAEGKIWAYGVALGPRIGWRDETIEAITTRDVAVAQIIYNLLEQEPGREIFPIAAAHDVGVMVRVPTSSGMLEGIYTRETVFPASDHRSHRERKWLIEGLEKAERVAYLQQRYGDTPTQSALRFILSTPIVTSITPNFTSKAQIDEAVAAADGRVFTTGEMQELSDLYDRNFDVSPVEDMRKLVATAGRDG